ncbi:MAG: hypothetical protein H0V17_08610, partial [Deltaproteobacteria bacterium]|nr:hypothetical protein [Deltaproteobacteria bacterium]
MKRFRARVVAVSVIAASIVAACQYTAPDSPADAASDGPATLPDAGACTAAITECFSDGSGGTVLRSCSAEGAEPTIEGCPWGCLESGGAHCGLLQPSGGAVLPGDLEPVAGQTLLPITISSSVSINTETGEISGGVRGAGTGSVNGIDFSVRGAVAVFRFQSLVIDSDV